MKRIVIMIAAAWFFTSCSGGEKTDNGASEALQAFYKTICSGKFAEAEALCHEQSMEGYINAFRSAWEQKDSALVAIASDQLAEMTINITHQQANAQNTTIFYELHTADGLSKEKVATLRKEEGEWKIEVITDRN